jgi:2-polyprenyl-3-methyl-5-hydroxy-6-metoxy-1,4-benzoquinol methylase
MFGGGEVSLTVLNTLPGSVHSRVIALVGENKSVLELGCSTGYMSAALQSHGCRVVGVERDPTAAGEAAMRCSRVLQADLDQVDLEEELAGHSFDVVVAADVLEHLRDPGRVLTTLRRLLLPGGHIVASVPNVAHGSVRLALLSGRFSYTDRGLLDRTHLRFFTRDTLERLFDEAGFVITALERIEAPIDGTEVKFDPELAPDGLMASLREDPEATTYQFVVVARPADALPSGMRERLRELMRERESAILRAESGERSVAEQRGEIERLTRQSAELENTAAILRSELDAHTRQAEVLLAEQVRLREALAARPPELEPAVTAQSDAAAKFAEEERAWRETMMESLTRLQTAFTHRFEELASALKAEEHRGEAAAGRLQNAEARAQTAAESEASLRRLLIEAHDELIQRDDHIIGLTRELGSHRLAAAELETLQTILAERDQGIAFLRGELKILEDRLDGERRQWEAHLAAAKEWAASESAAIRERDAIIEKLQSRPGPVAALFRGVRRATKLFGSRNSDK